MFAKTTLFACHNPIHARILRKILRSMKGNFGGILSSYGPHREEWREVQERDMERTQEEG